MVTRLQRPVLVALITVALYGYSAERVAAHPAPGAASGLTAGAVHPLTGLDHLLAMVAVGLWAAQRGGRELWALPATFLAVMALGGVLGALQVGLPWVEPGIAASVLVLGTLVAVAAQLPLAGSAAIVAACALVHGHAHGTELPATAAGIAYGAGFLASSAALILCGVGAATLWQRRGATPVVRMAGGAVAACGLLLCLS